MKLLTLDIGNTTVDAVLFEGSRITPVGKFSHSEIDKLPDSDLVVAVSVKPSVNERIKSVFGKKLKLLTLQDIPIKVDYRTPDTLGVDRVLFAYGVKEIYSESAILLMAGTALVVDLLLDGCFSGGFITAGLGLKLKALSEKTEGIPELRQRAINLEIGKSTEECVLGGVYLESLSFVKEVMKLWRERWKRRLPLYITGGDGELFKSMGFYDPIVLHKAMARIIING